MAGGFFTTSTWGNYINDCLANIEQNVTGCRLEKEVEAIFLFENPAVWPSSPKYVIGTRSQAEFEVDSRNARDCSSPWAARAQRARCVCRHREHEGTATQQDRKMLFAG